jgi:hypothetical protein
MPIHRCPVDILQLKSWTWCAIGPADMSTDKTLDILRSRQLFHEGYFTPNADIHWVTRRVASVMVGSIVLRIHHRRSWHVL